ncbi:MAG: response regulator [Chitinivibrionales bacterium]|nr:response regulator [Chitinivibrionales bacterium]MBD3356964.1 response regulator [Chitinivibrionales bacterium]
MSASFYTLVIDENPQVQGNLRRLLNRLGCEVTLADTEGQGISRLASSKYHAVFVALCGKAIRGREVARWVKIYGNGTKVFVVTSWRGELEEKVLAVDGIHGVVHKPLIFSEVRDVMLEHLG